MNHETREKVKDYLINNREHIKELINPFTIQKEELLKTNPELRKDIDEQYHHFVTHIIGNDITSSIGVDLLTILSIISRVDLLDYLNQDVIDLGEEDESDT